MFRYRRYRVFLVFAVISVLALYKFSSSSSSWREQAANRFQQGTGNSEDAELPPLHWQPNPQVAQETKKIDIEIPATKNPPPKQPPPPIAPVSKPVDKKLSPSPQPKKPAAKPTPAGVGGIGNDKSTLPDFTPLAEGGQGPLEVTPLPSSIEAIHWKKQKEHFPVPAESLVKLPTGKLKPIPRIQFDFKKESPAEKAERTQKLDIVRSVLKRSWTGYKQNAWLQDELSPVSGSSRNPFAGWGATLVDTLDTLWIMGLTEEFNEAVEAMKKIDFTTTTRADIPLFETTIRYLGGLVAAYDISGKKHKILLDKAVELAEVLISAFDTPNRMPETYYYWRPDFSLNPHRTSNRVILAEIGSLSMEFTRLAQLTGDHKYYDAIARITDNFEDFQNKTRLPGMWPTYLDASGCKRIDWTSEINKPLQKPIPAVEPEVPEKDAPEEVVRTDPLRKDPSKPLVLPVGDKDSPAPVEGEELSPGGHRYIPLERPSPLVLVPNGPNPTWKPPKEEPLVWPDSGLKKRQLDLEDSENSVTIATPTPTDEEADPVPLETRPSCEEQGFASSSDYGSEEYTLGGLSDSTYEYLSKEYLLLGGRVDKYRTMYERSMDVVKKHLIFRPMLPDENDILFSGKFHVPSTTDSEGNITGTLEPENAHLTCFAGGMFGMGAKIFDRPEDLEIAKKLTEGCVWSYNMTATGIMPEAFEAIPCESRKNCPWNETKYWEVLDPLSEQRMTQYKEAMVAYEEQMSIASSWYEQALKEMETAAPAPVPNVNHVPGGGMGAFKTVPTPEPAADILDKRQVAGDWESAALHVTTPEKTSTPKLSENRETVMGGEEEEAEGPPTKVQSEAEAESPLPSKTLPAFPVIYSPKAPLSHKEYVKNRIQEERLPKGVSHIQSRSYILRPEAIESVWYMYRITGDPYWRTAGWQMFEAVNSATAAEHGNSAIDDVTKITPLPSDEMESFWLAETLKYFYLLFAEESVVSLDEWVLNTEAHPFRRPPEPR